ncbi:MAG: hypothetical protein M3450_00015 [Actinomycetota bacterium]|nr:hypothetical protein [Actinomycetota bacterium]
MSAPPAVGVYRALLRLYPRRFREDYGPDMALLFADQLRDEPAPRVWARGLVDLAVTVPTRHLEAHMNRSPSPAVPLLFAVVALTGVCVAIIGGSSLGMLAVGLSVAAVAAALAVVAWRHSRPLAVARPATAHWWKFLTGGAGVLAAVIVITTATGEVGNSMWWPMMISVVCALMLLVTGLVLGVAHRSGNRPRNAPS